MILASSGIIASSISGVDLDYIAVLNYASSLGYTLPSLSQQNKQNKLLSNLKASGIWSKLDTFGVYANDGSSNFALIDWKRLSLFTAVNSPTFTTNQGFQGDGISSYIDLNYTITTNWVNASQDNTSVFVYVYRNPSPLNTIAIGSLNSSGLLISGNNSSFRLYNNPNVNFTNSVGIGLFTANRNTSTTVNAYINGNSLGTDNSSTSLSITSPVYLCRISGTFTTASPSLFGLGAYLNATDNINLNIAVSTYMNSL